MSSRVQEESLLATNLWEATDCNDIDKVRSLLGKGADPNHQLYWSEQWLKDGKLPPLHNACEKGYLDIVKELVNGGADVERKGGQLNRTAFHCACKGGNLKMVQYFVQDLNCNTDMFDKYKRTPLHWACLGGSEEIVHYITEKIKSIIEAKDKDNETPLHLACRRGQKNIVRFLVEKARCNTDVRDINDKTPLDLAIMYNETDIVNYLPGRLNIKNVKKAVWDVRSKWEQLAINLSIDMETIKTIKKSNHHEVEGCFLAMLDHWLARTSPDPSWLELADAVEDVGVENKLVGDQIRKQYLRY